MGLTFLTGSLFIQDPSALPVKTLLWTVAESIIQVFLLCVVGYILARTGVLDKATQRKVNVLNVSFATPALLGSKVAFSLTPEKLKEMWVIPLGFVIITAVSAGVAWVMGTMFRLSRSQRNSLPIALIQSLVVEVPHLKWGKSDTRDAMLGRALTYLVLYSTLGMMLRWSYGVKLLSQADDDDEQPEITTERITPQALLAAEPAGVAGVAVVEATETDPLFDSRKHSELVEQREEQVLRARTGTGTGNRQSSVDEGTLAWHSSADAAQSGAGGGGGTALLVASPPAITFPSADSPFFSHGASSASVPPLASASNQARRLSAMRRGSATGSGTRTSTPSGRAGARRTSTTSTMRPRAPSRTESGREFWGLPEARASVGSLSDQEEEGTSSGEEEEEDEEEDEEWGTSLPFTRNRQFPTPPSTRLRSFLRRARHRLHKVAGKVNQFMTVPMWSACLSVFVAMIPPLQAQLVRAKPLTQAITSAGQCSIPLTLVVLGAFFYTPAPPVDPSAPAQEQKPLVQRLMSYVGVGGTGHAGRSASSFAKSSLVVPAATASKATPGENRAVFVAVTSRMIFTPLLFMPVLAVLAKYDLFVAAADPVFIPPALTLAQLTQAASGDAFERLISKTISWSYAVLTPPLTLLYIFIGLLFGRL
ncbi:hypothetical protein QFC21_001165 [Naganishia friedmannii]|uniref:Uncharacterized protein n=1 Tax=Naganishia friedmannii TaxID=89922 RepID=A0ACC2W8R9_9TREE|nr:hypothetical protein QFC21_001165 [Naganishia friedmannii]